MCEAEVTRMNRWEPTMGAICWLSSSVSRGSRKRQDVLRAHPERLRHFRHALGRIVPSRKDEFAAGNFAVQVHALNQANHQVGGNVAGDGNIRIIVRPSPQHRDEGDRRSARPGVHDSKRRITVFQGAKQSVGREDVAEPQKQQRPAGDQRLPRPLPAREPKQEQSRQTGTPKTEVRGRGNGRQSSS